MKIPLLVILLVFIAGCASGTQSNNDDLLQQISELEAENEQLKLELADGGVPSGSIEKRVSDIETYLELQTSLMTLGENASTMISEVTAFQLKVNSQKNDTLSRVSCDIILPRIDKMNSKLDQFMDSLTINKNLIFRVEGENSRYNKDLAESNDTIIAFKAAARSAQSICEAYYNPITDFDIEEISSGASYMYIEMVNTGTLDLKENKFTSYVNGNEVDCEWNRVTISPYDKFTCQLSTDECTEGDTFKASYESIEKEFTC